MANSKTHIEDVVKDANGGEEGKTITQEKLEELLKAAEDLKTLQGTVADLQKAVTDKEAAIAEVSKERDNFKVTVENLEKAARTEAENKMKDVVKGFTFVPEEKQADLVKALLNDKDGIFLDVLEKARTTIVEQATKENGHDNSIELGDVNKSVNDKVATILKARKNQ